MPDRTITLEELHDLVLQLCRRITRPGSGWSPVRYNQGRPWDAESANDLTNDVFRHRLLVNDHKLLNEILLSESDLDQIRKRLSAQIRYTLQAREQHEPFNQLIRRVRRLADDGAFERHTPKGQPEWLSLPGTTVEFRRLTPDEVLRCVHLCQDLPVVYSRRSVGAIDIDEEGRQRRRQGSRMYDTDDLSTAVQRILTVAGCVNLGQLREIFSRLLTPWSVIPVVTYDESRKHEELLDDDPMVASEDDPTNDPDQPMSLLASDRLEIEFPELAGLVLQLSYEETYLLLAHGSGQTDVAIAQHLDVVRQTAAKRRRAALDRVGDALKSGVNAEAGAHALRTLAISHLADLHVQTLPEIERRLWIRITQGAIDSASSLCVELKTDLSDTSAQLIARFNEGVLGALISDDSERQRFEHRLAIEASLASCAERTDT